MQEGKKIVAQNRKAYHDYFIEDRLECGIALFGTEVKSLRGGAANLRDSYCAVQGGELYVHHLHISPYEQGNIFNREATRVRKLLAHKREIRKLAEASNQKGLTLVPLELYFERGRAKILIGVARGKKNYDKRHAIAERDAKLSISRTLRSGEKGE